ncbi:hypothetical protein Hdeb2414_s0010g00331431 [Helianthus debilis subsp. tardiflorus]
MDLIQIAIKVDKYKEKNDELEYVVNWFIRNYLFKRINCVIPPRDDNGNQISLLELHMRVQANDGYENVNKNNL